jgi:hypothetical protein
MRSANLLPHLACRSIEARKADLHYVEPPPPNLPPPKAYAGPDSADPKPAQDGLSPIKQIGECIHEVVGAVIERHNG